MLLLVMRLRDRCATLLRRRVPPTSVDAGRRPSSCRDTLLDACLRSTAFVGGLAVIVAVVYAAHSPHWLVLDLPSSPGCDHHVRATASPAARRGSSDNERAGGVAGPSSSVSGSTATDQRTGCTTGVQTHVGPWTICAVYDNQLHSCGT